MHIFRRESLDIRQHVNFGDFVLTFFFHVSTCYDRGDPLLVGVLFTYTLHFAIGLTTAHSGEPLAPKTVAWAVWAGACCGGTQ